MRCHACLTTLFTLLLLAPPALGEPTTWQKPPKEVLEVFSAPPFPDVIVDPTQTMLLLATPIAYPSIADLAQPMHKLAGIRVVERNHSRYAARYWKGLDLLRVADGAVVSVALPPGAKTDWPRWSADGTQYAFAIVTPDSVELWCGEAATSRVRKVEGVRLNPFFGSPIEWMPDQRTLLVRAVPSGHGPPPERPSVPPGPNVKETAMGSASSTYEVRDVLTSGYDEDLFDHFGATQLALVDVATGHVKRIGEPAIYVGASPSPDGHLLVESVHRPYSRLTMYNRFPRTVDVWDSSGALVKRIASTPLHESVPIWGEPTGPRQFAWRATAPATVLWVEALDGGDWNQQVPHRDKVMAWAAPFSGEPAELCRTEQRFARFWWSDAHGLALLNEYDAITHSTRVSSLEVDTPGAKPQMLWERSTDDKYNDAGTPVLRCLDNGFFVVEQEGNSIWLSGNGASPEGDRPFLDRFDLETRSKERLFRCEPTAYESFRGWIDRRAGQFLVRRETPRDPPNYFVRTLAEQHPATGKGEAEWTSSLTRTLTRFADPTPQIRGITKRLVTYERDDGLDLFFTLYLPPGYDGTTRLPAVFYAYPLDYADPSAAGQVYGSTQRFTTISSQHELYFLLLGYAVIGGPSLPIVGDTNRIYDEYMEQLLAGAKAAVDEAVELGVVDPDRIGVMGHSHGGLMTVNLLTHSDLFRAGIARSGAYNRSLTAFGFQNERRTLWEATDVYIAVSPFFHVDELDDPLLIIHGEVDANPGTTPIQSELLYEAIRGNGGTARLVMLPYESHGYAAEESNAHVLAEEIAWFERYVKNAPSETAQK
jgi:dipeptidyl aminopeptidase/acylaminoacyl peptidase